MKKILYFLFATMLMLVSCTHDMGVSSENAVINKYDATFVKTFGNPSPTQDWGFATRTIPAATRTAMPNGNQWGTHDDNDKYINFPKPQPITEDELNAVLAVFNEKGAEHYTSLIDWQNFYVQQVYTGPNGDKMTELASTVDYTVTVNTICWWPLEQETIVTQVDPFDDIFNNFNNGDNNTWDGCMLMFNSATKDFSWKTVQSGGPRYYGHWRMEKINGNYYVGFDHEAIRNASANDNEEDVRDYIYNDWIVKLVPGIGQEDPVTYKARIICEDLSVDNSTDFDFNDAVFDVTYTTGTPKMTVVLRAAGGTIPLYVAGKEVHQLFKDANPDAGVIVPDGDVKGTMINTSAAGGLNNLTCPSFEIDVMNPVDIPITVNKDGAIIQLKAVTGEPAAKIAVDPSFVWCTERSDIQKVYPNFSQYVQNEAAVWF